MMAAHPDMVAKAQRWLLRINSGEWHYGQLLEVYGRARADELLPVQMTRTAQFPTRRVWPCGLRSPWPDFRVYCSRRPGHGGRHAAGNGVQIFAVWYPRLVPLRDAGRASLGTLIALMLAVVFALAVSVAVAPPAGADGRTVLAVALALVALAVLPAASRHRRGAGQ